MIKILYAILAGMLTVGAPCILPLLPILLGKSVGHSGKMRPFLITLGFILTFTAIGLIFNYFSHLLGISQNNLRVVAVILLALFGIFMIWPGLYERMMIHLNPLVNKAEKISDKAGSGNWGGFALGVVIGIIWTPCAGPVLGSILTLIATSKDVGKAGILLAAYAIGAGIPMLIIAYSGQYLTTKIRSIAKYLARIQQVFGVLILFLAFAIYFQYDVFLSAKLANVLPG